MTTRRNYLKYMTLAGASLTVPSGLLNALEGGEIITRAIPSSGEKLPIVGLGSSATFSSTARSEDVDALRNVMSVLFENGGSVFDTAPAYGASEQVAGGIVQDLDATQKVFWATKMNVAGRGGGKADSDAARAQLEKSFERIGKDPIDLVQVHNLGDLATQYPILEEYKAEGRIRYIGTTSTRANRYSDLVKFMREQKPDFIGVDYAVDNTRSADEILPLAQELGIGVLVYAPFGRTRLFSRVKGHEVPAWAQEFGCESWAQFFIKFSVAHPAVTAVTPATSKPKNMLDNLGAMVGELPDAATQKRMVDLISGLPSA
jgi:aryl-alcohol dehydrogenase-like predicted oxidoreductase